VTYKLARNLIRRFTPADSNNLVGPRIIAAHLVDIGIGMLTTALWWLQQSGHIVIYEFRVRSDDVSAEAALTHRHEILVRRSKTELDLFIESLISYSRVVTALSTGAKHWDCDTSWDRDANWDCVVRHDTSMMFEMTSAEEDKPLNL
jgi:hypothetical protein